MPKHRHYRASVLHRRRSLVVPSLAAVVLTAAISSWLSVFHRDFTFTHNAVSNPPEIDLSELNRSSETETRSGSSPEAPKPSNFENSGPYHNWELFAADFEQMVQNLKIYAYPEAFANDSSSPFRRIFLPHPNPKDPRLGNYFSEHMFKVSLLGSSVVTTDPEQAHLFFLPFSVNSLRNDPRVRSEAAIADFVGGYVAGVGRRFPFWNASGGADHFFACCHSVGREAASSHRELQNNAIHVTCSSSYFQRFYVAHRDVGLPQIWPRPPEKPLNPSHERWRLVFFAGRIQNSRIRQELIASWGNETDMDIFSRSPPFSYEEGFRRSKYCLHVKGYEVNTARLADAIHYGCVPIILSNHYDLPFANVLDWNKFSVIINHREIPFLKTRLQEISNEAYIRMYRNLCRVRRHFVWHAKPRGYDSFYMTAYQLWLRRGIVRLQYADV